MLLLLLSRLVTHYKLPFNHTYFRMQAAFHSKYMKCFFHTCIPAKENFREEMSILVCMLPYKYHDRRRFRDNVEHFRTLVLNVDMLQSSMFNGIINIFKSFLLWFDFKFRKYLKWMFNKNEIIIMMMINCHFFFKDRLYTSH